MPTLIGLKPRGFFIPYRYAGDLPPRDRENAYPEVEHLLTRHRANFEDVLREVDRHASALRAFHGQPAGTPRWDQDWFPRLDGAAAYALVRSRKPRRIVEIGSGHSTRFLARAAQDEGLDCAITAVDPAPRATLAALAGVTHVPLTLQELLTSGGTEPGNGEGSLSCLEELAPGDILFVDSSHILMPGSDVDLIVNSVLPRLPAGILVHVHDVFLPDDYPSSWTWRGYNEQSVVASLLTTGAYNVLFASRYVSTRMSEAVGETALAALPLLPGAFESSLWLVKLAGPQ